MNLRKNIEETLSCINKHTNSSFKPEIAIILGSGLGGIADQINVSTSIDYGSITNFPIPTVMGHSGKFILGELGGRKVVAMQGRFHYYEGLSMQEVTFPVRIMKCMGAETIIISNAAGGLNPDYKTGDFMIIRDHINLTGDNPLRGSNDDSMGPRFPDQHCVYNKDLITKASEIAKTNNITCHQGVYAGITGPTFETPAEYKYLRLLGGDAVGMSTVPEAIVANHMGMKIFGISVITNEGNAPSATPTTHEDVLKASAAVESKLSKIISELIKGL